MALGAALTLAVGCSTPGERDDSAPVVATSSIWADIASEVGCGADVPSLVPAGADPHTFEPTLRDREMVDRATTVIGNGLGLEDSLADLLADATLIEVANDVDLITAHAAGHDPAHDRDGDPHIWQDPRRVAGTLDTIAEALAASGVETCADDYREQLAALDTEIVEILDVVPVSSRILVTSHDSLAYFADRYGFEVVGTVIPSTNTLAETNASDLAALAAEIEARNVSAFFTEELESTADADALAARLGIDVVPLTTDALTDDPDTDTYVEMMRSNASKIAGALAP